jgi:hypothetical protein
MESTNVAADGTAQPTGPAPDVATATGPMPPSKWMVIMVGGALAWLAFARSSFSKLG